jgi:hypothetical protein
MPAQASRFHVTLKDPDTAQKRFVTLSRVPCPTCENDPVLKGGYRISDTSEKTVPACKECGGTGDVPATADSAAAFLEQKEKEYVAFRLDDPRTLARYKDSLPQDALEVVEQTCVIVPEDTVLVDGRFVRAGKVLRAGNPDPAGPAYARAHKGWLQFHAQEDPYKVDRVGRDSEKMVVTGGQYGVPLKNLYTGNNTWDWDTNVIKCALTTSAYTVDIDTHDFFNDVTNEITGTNYTAGGFTLGTATSSYDTATDQIRLAAANVSQATATFTARRAVVYNSSPGTAATNPLITFLDFGADVSPSAGTFAITWDATGIFVHDIT